MELKLENITIYYEVKGEGRPVIMLHGMTLDHRHMVSAFEPIFANRRGWKRIYFDLPGMGKTPGQDWIKNQDQVLEIIQEFIEQIILAERFVVVGISYGGLLARGLVYQMGNRIDGLLLVVPTVFKGSGKKDLPSPMPIATNPDLVAETAQKFPQGAEVLKNQVVQNQAVLDWWMNNIRPANELMDATFLTRIDSEETARFSYDIDALPKPFPGPTLILMGRQDTGVGYRDQWQFVENYPRGSYVVLDRAGHMLLVHQPNLFKALVNEWLDRVGEYTGQVD